MERSTTPAKPTAAQTKTLSSNAAVYKTSINKTKANLADKNTENITSANFSAENKNNTATPIGTGKSGYSGKASSNFVNGIFDVINKGNELIEKLIDNQKAIEEKGINNISNKKLSSKTHVIFTAKDGMTNTGADDADPGIIMDFSKTTYEPISRTTSTTSSQYGILHDSEYTYIDTNGLCRNSKVKGTVSSNDYYVVAMGYKFEQEAKQYDSKYDPNIATKMAKYNGGKTLNFTSDGTVNAGYTFKVDLKDTDGNSYSIDVLLADTKGGSNSFVPHDNVIEFFADGAPNPQICNAFNNVDFAALVGANSTTSIQTISIYEDGAKYNSLYDVNGWHRVDK